MEPENQEEWFALRTEAREILRIGFPQNPHDHRLFQFVVLPSFEASYSWELYEQQLENGKVEAIAINAIWRMLEDIDKFHPLTRLRHPQKLSPTMAVKTGRIEQALAATLLAELSEISVPLGPYKDELVLDGTSYELTVGTGHTQSRFTWHDHGPSPWNPLRIWTSQIVNKLALK
jgi:hypothetical protein